MTETLQAPLREMGDIKIFILSLMAGIDRPLDFIEVNDIVIQNGVVRPFDFCVAFPELIETGHVAVQETERGEVYTVTELGREAAYNLGSKILHTTKDKALQNAILLLNLRSTGGEYRYSTQALPNGRFQLQISFIENGEETLAVSVVTETRREAENMEFELEQHPDLFRRVLLSMLYGNAGPVREYHPYLLIN